MKIKTGNFEVFYSGTVIQIVDEPIQLTFEDRNKNPLSFIFRFEDDKNEKGQITNYNLVNNTTLEIKFLNFNNSMGIGNTELIPLGNFDQKKLYFNYRIYHINGIGKTFHFTFYLGEEVKND